MAGLTTAVGGWLVVKTPEGGIEGYDRLGWIAVIAAVFSLWLATRVRNVEHPNPPSGDQVNRSNG